MDDVGMQFPERMIGRVGSVQTGKTAGVHIANACSMLCRLCKDGYVAVKARVHKSPEYLAFKIVAQIVICITTKNARENFGLTHTSGGEPPITPSAKEAHGSGFGEGQEGAFQFQG